jgi:hypothetical protein
MAGAIPASPIRLTRQLVVAVLQSALPGSTRHANTYAGHLVDGSGSGEIQRLMKPIDLPGTTRPVESTHMDYPDYAGDGDERRREVLDEAEWRRLEERLAINMGNVVRSAPLEDDDDDTEATAMGTGLD